MNRFDNTVSPSDGHLPVRLFPPDLTSWQPSLHLPHSPGRPYHRSLSVSRTPCQHIRHTVKKTTAPHDGQYNYCTCTQGVSRNLCRKLGICNLGVWSLWPPLVISAIIIVSAWSLLIHVAHGPFPKMVDYGPFQI